MTKDEAAIYFVDRIATHYCTVVRYAGETKRNHHFIFGLEGLAIKVSIPRQYIRDAMKFAKPVKTVIEYPV